MGDSLSDHLLSPLLQAMKNFPLQFNTERRKSIYFGHILEGEWRQIHLLQL